MRWQFFLISLICYLTMKSFGEKYNRRRYRTAYSTSVFSIALVLFLLSLLGLMIFFAGKLKSYFRENIGISLVIDSEAEAGQILEFKDALEKYPYVKSVRYISKQQAAEQLKAELGEDFVKFIGYNPLPPTLEMFLYDEYTQSDSLAVITNGLYGHNIIRNIEYEHQLLDLIDTNISRISTWIVVFSGLLLIVSVVLIHNTIRLSIYSKRMLIKSMVLVGASQPFIRRPFIRAGLYQGLTGGLLAVCLLIAMLLFASIRMPELSILEDVRIIVWLGLGIMAFGLLITWLSTYIAVKKYLKIRSEDLY